MALLSAHSDFGFFSCAGYLPSKLHIKDIKTPFGDLGLNDMNHIPPRMNVKKSKKPLWQAHVAPSVPGFTVAHWNGAAKIRTFQMAANYAIVDLETNIKYVLSEWLMY